MEEQMINQPQTDSVNTKTLQNTESKHDKKNIVPILIAIIVTLLFVIIVLLVMILTTKPLANDIFNPTPIQEIPTASSAPFITVTNIPTVTLKDFSVTVKTYTPDPTKPTDRTVIGQYPADSITKTTGLDAAGVNFSNNNYSLSVLFVSDGQNMHYASYKTLPPHDEFGYLYRVSFSETGNQAYYVIDQIITTGTCPSLGENIQAPCGPDTISGSSANYLLSIRCTADPIYMDSICDSIVDSLRVQ